MLPPRPFRFRLWDVLALGVVLVAGTVNLPTPFHGDQALYVLGAEKASRGAVLYRDFWELRQPGLFGFNIAAGQLFGFTEVGIHLFELLYLLGFSAVLVVALNRYYTSSGLTALVPVLSVGFYFAVAGPWHLTQIEGLVGFPLFACLWLATRPGATRARASWLLLLSGVMGGVVLLFKLMFLPLLVAFWAVPVVAAVAGRQEPFLKAIARVVAPLVAGLLCALLPVLWYFARDGVLDILYETFFLYPPRIVSELPSTGFGVLLNGLLWFTGRYAPILALAVVGAYRSLKERRDGRTVGLVLWVVVGLAVILVQRRSWWPYQYLLLSVPLAVLAVRGIELVWERLDALGPAFASRSGRAVVVVSLACLFFPAAGSLVQKVVPLAQHGFALDPTERRAYQCQVDDNYRRAVHEVSFLTDPSSSPGPIYVFGNPIYYRLSGRDQAISLHGWSIELYLPEQWERLREELAAARPPYIFVAADNRDLIPARSPATSRFLEEHYEKARESGEGVWYVPRERGR